MIVGGLVALAAAAQVAAQQSLLDAYEHVAVIGSGVNIRLQPGGEVIASVGHQTVRRTGQQAVPGWVGVVLDDGRTGYIEEQSVRSPIGYRATFTRREGRWWLVSFISGD